MGQWMMLVLSRRYSTLPALASLNSLGDVGGDGAGLGGGHQALGAQNLTQTANDAHHVGGGDDHVEVEPVLLLDLLDQIHRRRHSRHRRPWQPRPCRPWRTPARGRSCRCRWAGRWRRGPAGQRGGSRRPGVTCSSTVSSNLAVAVFTTSSMASAGSYGDASWLPAA